MKRILLLSEMEAKNTLYCTHTAGYEVIVAGEAERNKMLRFNPMCRKFIPLKNKLIFTGHQPELIEEIISILKAEKIDVLLPSGFDCIRLLSLHYQEFRKFTHVVPVPQLSTIAMLDNKYSFYRFCVDKGLSHPDSHYVETLESIRQRALPQMKYPLMLKPVLGAGHEGLKIFDSEEQLYTFFDSKPEYELKPLLPALLQDYFEGEDIDFNGFAVNGKLLASSVMRTEYYTNKPSFSLTWFVEHAGVEQLGREICRHANYSGPLNIDMRIRKEDGRVMLIEVNPRFWARTLYSLMDGMNFVDIGINAALEHPYRSESRRIRANWVSSPMRAALALVLNRDARCLHYIRKLSRVQIKFWLFDLYVKTLARLLSLRTLSIEMGKHMKSGSAEGRVG